MTLSLPVVETFGPTIQGEGPYAGRNADFIRLAGCNLSCQWCDTPYSWDGRRYDLRAEITETPVTQLIDGIRQRSGIVVITGGEPMLYARRPAFAALLAGIAGANRPIHVETNGSILPPPEIIKQVDVFVVSPKLPNADLPTASGGSSLAEGWAEAGLRSEVYVKVVCEGEKDVLAAVEVANRAQIERTRLWVMPQAADAATLATRWPVIADAAAKAGVNATSRLHLLAWGNERGR